MSAVGTLRQPNSPDGGERKRRLRQRNLALLAALAGFVVLVYVITMVKMGGG